MDRVNYEISTQMARILKNTILKTTIDPMLEEANEYDGLERFLIDRTPIPYRKNWRNKKSSTLFSLKNNLSCVQLFRFENQDIVHNSATLVVEF